VLVRPKVLLHGKFARLRVAIGQGNQVERKTIVGNLLPPLAAHVIRTVGGIGVPLAAAQ